MSDDKIIKLVQPDGNQTEPDPAARSAGVLEAAKAMGFHGVVVVGVTPDGKQAILTSEHGCCAHMHLHRAAHTILMHSMEPG